MKNNYLIAFSIAISFLLTSCGGGTSKSINEITDDTESAEQLKNLVESQNSKLEKELNTAPMPSENERYNGITGVDKNNNNVRDDIEQSVYQGLRIHLLKENSTVKYEQLIDLIKKMQPINPPVANSIDEHEIYCTYNSLSKETKDEFSFNTLLYMVNNTRQRERAYYSSLKRMSNDLGKLLCN